MDWDVLFDAIRDAQWGDLNTFDIIIIFFVIVALIAIISIPIVIIKKISQIIISFSNKGQIFTKFGVSLPYRLGNSLLTDREKEFFHVLYPIASKHNLQIAIKPRIADFIDCTIDKNKKKKFWYYFKNISQKHVDFLLCNPSSFSPILAVELDDATHLEENRVERDEFVDKLYNKVGLPVAHYYDYTAESIEHDILKTLLFKTPCKLCNGSYKLRTNSETNKNFGGCSNFPKCKSSIEIDEAICLYT